MVRTRAQVGTHAKSCVWYNHNLTLWFQLCLYLKPWIASNNPLSHGICMAQFRSITSLCIGNKLRRIQSHTSTARFSFFTQRISMSLAFYKAGRRSSDQALALELDGVGVHQYFIVIRAKAPQSTSSTSCNYVISMFHHDVKSSVYRDCYFKVQS